MTCKETGNFCHNTEKKRSQLKKNRGSPDFGPKRL